jgi:hypothetical protein
MAWIDKQKIPQQGNDEEILTPDGFQILVGTSEDLVLLWQVAFNNWTKKVKNIVTDWSLKAKTVS